MREEGAEGVLSCEGVCSGAGADGVEEVTAGTSPGGGEGCGGGGLDGGDISGLRAQEEDFDVCESLKRLVRVFGHAHRETGAFGEEELLVWWGDGEGVRDEGL